MSSRAKDQDQHWNILLANSSRTLRFLRLHVVVNTVRKDIDRALEVRMIRYLLLYFRMVSSVSSGILRDIVGDLTIPSGSF